MHPDVESYSERLFTLSRLRSASLRLERNHRLSPLARQQMVQSLTLTAMTPFTLTTVAQLMADLDACAERGYAIDDQENELGGRCVAAPVFDWTAKVVGAVSLSAPLTRFPMEQMAAYSQDICATAQAISASMGYRAS